MIITDAARRISDRYNQFRLDHLNESFGKWFAVNLGDGRSDGVMYDSKRDAVRHVPDERHYGFIQIGPWQMPPDQAQVWLRTMRAVVKSGKLKMGDPDDKSGGRDIIRRLTQEDQVNQIRAMFGRGIPSNISYRK